MTTTKARINLVKFATDLEIECLMLPDGSFGIGTSQIASVFSFPNKHLSRDLKALMGNDISFPKTTSELNSKSVNYITLDQFLSVCVELTAKGNGVAKSILKIHAGASLRSVVSAAFGVKFDQEELVQFVEARTAHAKGFHPKFTRWLKEDGVQGVQYAVMVNKLKRKALLPLVSVDDYTKEELATLNLAEQMYDKLRTKGLTHEAAFELV